MKLDFLKDVSDDDGSFVRLSEFRSAEIQNLCRTFEGLRNGTIEHVAFEAAESLDGTQLTFTRAKISRGIVKKGAQSFDIILTPEDWYQCIGLLEPFCEPSWAYQWLCENVGKIRLLVSHDGDW